MSDPKGGMDEELRRGFRAAVNEEFDDWTFSAELRSAAQRQVREQNRLTIWSRTGRAARDAGWLVAAAAMVFILSGRGGIQMRGGHMESPPYGAATGAPAAAVAQQAAQTPLAPVQPDTSVTRAANSPAAEKSFAPLVTVAPAAPPAPVEQAPTGTAGASDGQVSPGVKAMADPKGEAVTVAPDEQATKVAGKANGHQGGPSLTAGGGPQPVLVQLLPTPVPAPAPSVTTPLGRGEQGLALQALPNALVVYLKTSTGPAVRSLNLDLQEQWSDRLDPQATAPVLQSHGSQVIGGYTLISQEGQFLLLDESGTIRVRLTAGEGITLRGGRLTGERWLTLVGRTGTDTAVWVVDLGQWRLLSASRLAGQLVDAVAIDAVHLAALDAKGTLLIIANPQP